VPSYLHIEIYCSFFPRNMKLNCVNVELRRPVVDVFSGRWPSTEGNKVIASNNTLLALHRGYIFRGTNIRVASHRLGGLLAPPTRPVVPIHPALIRQWRCRCHRIRDLYSRELDGWQRSAAASKGTKAFFFSFLLGRVLASHYGAISYLTVSQKIFL
jgi:hypothetical protein